MTATFKQPNQTTDTAPQYKANIDASIDVLAQLAAGFAAHEATPPDMTVVVDGGKYYDGSTVTARNQQITPVFTAPTTNPRIDRVAVDVTTGLVVVIAGTEEITPTAPAYGAHQYPVCQVLLTVGMTEIANADITDERANLVDKLVSNIIEDSNGNVGIGHTPHPGWGVTGWNILEPGESSAIMGRNQGDSLILNYGGYFDGIWKFKYNDESFIITLGSNGFTYQISPVGTPDSQIIFENAFTVDQAGAATIHKGQLNIGFNDAIAGNIHLFGGGAGAAEGSEIRFYTSADWDTVADFYFFDTYQDKLRTVIAGVGVVSETYPDRSVVFSAATGGPQGPGTINAKGFYVDGVPVGNTIPSLTGFVGAVYNYIDEDTVNIPTVLSVHSVVVESSWESVGPTGSGATNVWTALDLIPANAAWVEVRVISEIRGSTDGQFYNLEINGRKTGTVPSGTLISQTSFTNRSGLLENLQTTTTAKIPLDSLRRFDVNWSTIGLSATAIISFYVTGFGA